MSNIKIAVMSDIHGNYIAFDECINYVLSNGINKFIFLGDYLGEFPNPQKTLSLLYSLDEKFECYFIRGNKEDYWINRSKEINCEWKNGNKSVAAMNYCYQELKSKDIEFFKKMPTSKIINYDGYNPIIACHGTPDSNRTKMLLDDDATVQIINENQGKLILCGHTHCQQKIGDGEPFALNPGAVGVPLHSGGMAQFMILEGTTSGWFYEFMSLPYDVDKEIEEIHSSGLYEIAPYWCQITEHLIRTGKISHGTVLNEALKLCEYKSNWYDIPDEFWKKAIINLID